MGNIACSMAGPDVRASTDEATGFMASCKDGELHTLVQREPDGEVWVMVMGQDTFIRVSPDGKVVANKPNNADGEMLSIRLLVDGSVQVLPIVDKANHGASIIRSSNGVVLIVPHVDGTENGASVTYAPDGPVMVIPYVDGKPHGRVVSREPDGEIWMQEVVMGENVGEESHTPR